MKHRTLSRMASAAALVAVSTLAACGGDSESTSEDDAQTSTGDAAAATSAAPPGSEAGAPPEPDVENVPEVVAEVNDEEISREDFVQAYESSFQQAAMQSQQTGGELDQDQLKQQTIEDMVSSRLLIQGAEEADISASEKEVDATIEELATSNDMESPTEFLSALEEQGLSEKDVRTAVEDQLKTEQFIAEESGLEDPSEKELRARYDELATQQEQAQAQEQQGGDSAQATLPPFEDVQPQLEEQMQQEQQSEAVAGIVEDLRKDADITVNL